MKKQLFSLLLIAIPLLAMAAGSLVSDEPIPFTGTKIDPTDPLVPDPKSPVQSPIVYLDGHTLDFQTNCDGCTLILRDETDAIVYNTIIPSCTTLLPLPSYFSGTYTIQIIRGYWLFTGEIELE